MGYDMIELTTDGAVATIKLDRPKALNLSLIHISEPT